jgi:hypothetical protein
MYQHWWAGSRKRDTIHLAQHTLVAAGAFLAPTNVVLVDQRSIRPLLKQSMAQQHAKTSTSLATATATAAATAWQQQQQ